MNLTKSWNNESELEAFGQAKNDNEIIQGLVRAIRKEKIDTEVDGVPTVEEQEVIVIDLPFGQAYCLREEFSEISFRSLGGFAGSMQHVVVTFLDLDKNIAWVSVKRATKMRAQLLWNEIEEAQASDTLNERTYLAIITGVNEQTNRIFIEIEGASAFITNLDWEHRRVNNVAEVAQRGEKIEVKIVRFDKERSLIQASRKATIPDPFKELAKLEPGTTVPGRVINIHPVHGIFVRLDNGCEVKGEKPRALEMPVPNDIVSCRIRFIDAKERKGKVIITGYPQGKKRVRDVGAFLYQ